MRSHSSLVYEHAVLKLHVERFLLEVSQDDPTFGEAHRLLQLVQTFVPIFEHSVPQISLLWEFVNGSAQVSRRPLRACGRHRCR